ncbi:MAG TPA: M20/M25/M40 family metallo-hydrolase [Burkholderiales bacterium]|nr:M20/M25/M40 family metallo-hydrolase [Burkholderiales bacterium]
MSDPLLSAETLADWVLRFVRYPSEQGERMEAEPAVLGFVRECVKPLADSLGLSGRFDEMGNYLMEIGPAGGEPALAFFGYAMTHPAAGMARPFAGERLQAHGEPAIRGRGVSEQKSALAAALAAFADAARSRLAQRVCLVVTTAGETGRHDAASCALQALGAVPRRAVVALGTDSRVSLGNRGRIDAQIVVRGKAAHSSSPDAGIDAIAGLREVLDALARVRGTLPRHAELGPATLTPTGVESFPKATHTVQDEVRLTIDRRLLPGERAEDALEAIRAALPAGRPWSTELQRGAHMLPHQLAREAPLVGLIAEAHRRAALEAPRLFYSAAALDAGFLTARGAEATMWGPGAMEQFHSSEEFVRLRDVLDVARAYRELIALAAA